MLRHRKYVVISTNIFSGSKEKLKMIDELRKKGCFVFNTYNAYNNNQLLVTRRPREILHKRTNDFLVCPHCKGFYSKISIRRHFLKCNLEVQKFAKNLPFLSRVTYGQVHKKASVIMKTEIIPRMRDDNVTHKIRFDELAIIYGNKLSLKYRRPHLQYMIRSKLRLIGRLMIALEKINPQINDFSSVFHPKYYDDIIKSICEVALINEQENEFKSPATAASYGTLPKKCGRILINEYIKQEDEQGQLNTKNFLSILDEDFQTDINKTVQENQSERRRRKSIILPIMDDIKKLNGFLNTQRTVCYTNLKQKFDIKIWKQLAEYTLISIQVFNRRRAGEIERVLITDFNTHQTINADTDPDIFNSLSEESKLAASQYRRFEIRGKLGRNVPVLLNDNHFKCIQLILHFRNEAGVSKENPYVFGLTGGNNTFLRACKLLRSFSKLCGAKNPENLRGTQLRKHIATRSILLDLENQEISDLAHFMGHNEAIHRSHYRIPIVTRDIIKMSKLLEIAQGNNEQG